MTHPPVPSLLVAGHILNRATSEERPVTPMLMLKLVYIAHGFFLALYDRPLISDRIEAWQYGPVIPDLYNRIRHYKAARITDLGSLPPGALNETQKKVVNVVFDKYKKYTAWELSAFTHQDGAPWCKVWDDKGWYGIIPDDVIGAYYKTLLVD